MTRILNFINGELVAPVAGEFMENVEPATGQIYGQISNSNVADVQAAVDAAKAAWPGWKQTTPQMRAVMLNRLADLMEAKQDDFIRAESIDNGKPVSLAGRVDVPRGIANLRAFAGAALEFGGERFEKETSSSYTLRPPIGIVSVISPWNLPLLLFTWKLAPALAAGNCVIAKPSEVTPMTAFMLSQLLNDAGFPKGVVNILHGRGASVGAAITDHPDIRAISFTGGTETGTIIYSGAAKQLKKVSLELGGKNPAIIFEDADWENMLDGVRMAAFANQGQVCLCGSRILVQKSVYERFKTDFLAKISEIKIGDPLEVGTTHGATVSRDHMEKVLGYIDLAKQEGGTVLAGGKQRIVEGRCVDGFFIEPTVIEGLPATCRTNQEEIFGPVVTLMPFETEEEALEIANSTEYGLAASVWTGDDAKASRMAQGMVCGIVWLNCWNLRDLDTPFGGMKKSGIGREGKWRALQFFTEEKTVTRPV
ncbi:MAG: aldehyde dehydrogenase [Rickettsiales bacterium]|nr:aldehyde dehydrogenase [Rickettsiales bacterium]